MPSDPEHPALEALQDRLREEEAAYAEVLATLDRLAAFPLPAETAPEVRQRLERLNELWAVPERPAGGGLGGAVRRRAWDALAPALERQAEFNAALVQLLNAHLSPVEQLHAHLRELAGALVRYAQRLQPLVDAGDRVASALATTRSELILESFDRRLESLGRRLEGLLALRDRLETMGEEVRALRAHPRDPAAAGRGPRGRGGGPWALGYAAFENRFRGSREEIRERLQEYAGALPRAGPGGRPRLRARRVPRGAAGRRASRPTASRRTPTRRRECREKGLDVSDGRPRSTSSARSPTARWEASSRRRSSST